MLVNNLVVQVHFLLRFLDNRAGPERRVFVKSKGDQCSGAGHL